MRKGVWPLFSVAELACRLADVHLGEHRLRERTCVLCLVQKLEQRAGKVIGVLLGQIATQHANEVGVVLRAMVSHACIEQALAMCAKVAHIYL